MNPPLAYHPVPPVLWRIPDAVRRIAGLLERNPASLPLERCLPPIPRQAPDRPIRLRGALASTFVAGLNSPRMGQSR
ncbi:hypothetical protein [Roseomonas xinghualingensis]|uniref:hypothetical protein n=1 Tax=Roseomonas xinghualingensis TaxID=2986475 RepID=UPI0021F11A39|nr:hypothetical protein [Roseomonas sp. SXEYE001]MCV4209461.1 hypothetical protein [Roseomonas sp. SXEYE001]